MKGVCEGDVGASDVDVGACNGDIREQEDSHAVLGAATDVKETPDHVEETRDSRREVQVSKAVLGAAECEMDGSSNEEEVMGGHECDDQSLQAVPGAVNVDQVEAGDCTLSRAEMQSEAGAARRQTPRFDGVYVDGKVQGLELLCTIDTGASI